MHFFLALIGLLLLSLIQARKANSGTMRMKRSLLVKAGEALAPDAFLLVLDSESDTKGTNNQNTVNQ